MAKKIVISFGRMNPITIGHESLVKKIVATASSKNAVARLYLSHTQNSKKDPLSYSDKMKFARLAFGKVATQSNAKTLIEVMKTLQKEKFTDVTVVVGSDRVSEFETLLTKYNGKEFKFANIDIVSAGERDPDAEGLAGMSGSKMRALAVAGKEKEFMAGAASMPALKKKMMYKAVRAGLSESLEDTMEDTMALDEEFEKLFEKAEDEGDDDINLSVDDVSKMVDDMDHDDLDPHEHDAYFLHLIGPEYLEADDEDAHDDAEEESVDEAVATLAQRMKMSMRMRRMAKRYATLRKLKAKRMAPAERLRYRSRKAALMAIRRRVLGKTRQYSELSKQQRVSLDQQIARRFGKKLNARIDMLSKRILPAVRKKEMERVAQARSAAPKTEAAVDPSHLHLTDSGAIKKKHVRVFEELYAEARRSATTDQGDEGDNNIIYQLRKVQALGGAFSVTWSDGTKSKISVGDAMKGQELYKKLTGPGVMYQKRLKFVRDLGRSEKSFYNTIKEEVEVEEIDEAMKFDKQHSPMPQMNQPNMRAHKDAADWHRGHYEQATNSKEKMLHKERMLHHTSQVMAMKGMGIKEEVAEAKAKPNNAMLRAKLIAKMTQHSPKFAAAMKSSEPKKEEVNEAPDNDSKLTPKVDLLLRLGLVDADSINSYRTALRGGEKSLTNPALRQKLMNLLDRLLDLSTKDPQTFNRMRTTVREDAMADKHDSEQDALAIRHAREKAMAKARAVIAKTIKKEIKDEIQLSDKALANLTEKAIKHDIDIDIIMEVYARGLNDWIEGAHKNTRDQWAFNRVNSFLMGGAATKLDADLWEQTINELSPDTMKKYAKASYKNYKGLKKVKIDHDPEATKERDRRLSNRTAGVMRVAKKLSAESAGEFGTDKLRKTYANDTPGQEEEIITSSFSAKTPWVSPQEENVDTGRSPKTYQDIRKAIAGIRDGKK